MRPLLPQLVQAQQETTLQPAIRCTLRPADGTADRYVFGAPQTPAGLPAACATACLASSGLLYLYALDTATGRVGVATFDAAGGQTGWTILSTVVSATLLAACLLPGGGACLAAINGSTGGGTVLCLYLATPAGPVTRTETVAMSSGYATFGLAIAAAPDGRIACVQQGSTGGYYGATYTVFFTVRSAAGVWGPVVTQQGGAAPGGMALLYAGDWLIAAAASWDAGTQGIGLWAYGDGGRVPAGTWSPRQVIVATADPGTSTGAHAGTRLALGGAAASDVLRLTLLETFTNQPTSGAPIQWARVYQITVQDAAAWLGGRGREPQPLPAQSLVAPAYDAATGVLWLAGAAAVLHAPAPQTLDLSGRVLRADRQEGESGGQARLLLDDSDGALTALAADPETIGARLTLDMGYVTPGGPLFSPGALLWVTACTAHWDGERRLVEIAAGSGAALLAGWRPRRSYAWLPGQATIAEIVAFLCGKAGLAFLPPAALSTLAQERPAYIVRPGADGLRATLDLLRRVPECLRFTAAGVTLVQPLLQQTPAYSYGQTGSDGRVCHPVVAARATVHGSGVTHVLVFGRASSDATVPTALAESHDVAAAYREGPRPLIDRDMYLATADAQARADTLLAKARLIGDAGEIAAAPNAGLEVWDRIAVTCPALGWMARSFWVREIRTLYDAAGAAGLYIQHVGLMSDRQST
jgi:hypothetical protein